MPLGSQGRNNTVKEIRKQPKDGMHKSRLVGVVDLGHQPPFEARGKMVESSYKYEFIYELLNLPDDYYEENAPHWISEEVKDKWYKSDKAGLSDSKLTERVEVLEAFSGKDSNQGRNFEILIGEACVTKTKVDAKGYSKITGVTELLPGTEVPELMNPPLIFDWGNPDKETWDRLSPLTKRKIQQALDYDEKLKDWVDSLEA